MFEGISQAPRRLIIDTAIGTPARSLDVLSQRAAAGQAISDLNWYRLSSWRENLAMVFDHPGRRDALAHVVQLDIDVQGHQPVQGLLMAAWIANRLGWSLESSNHCDGDGISASFRRPDGLRCKSAKCRSQLGSPAPIPAASWACGWFAGRSIVRPVRDSLR